jgi:hypothetical protein
VLKAVLEYFVPDEPHWVVAHRERQAYVVDVLVKGTPEQKDIVDPRYDEHSDDEGNDGGGGGSGKKKALPSSSLSLKEEENFDASAEHVSGFCVPVLQRRPAISAHFEDDSEEEEDEEEVANL